MSNILWKDDNGQWWFFKDVDSDQVQFHQPGTERIQTGYGDNDYKAVSSKYAWCEPNSFAGPVRGRKVNNLPL
jgi:hypothetical protein